MAEVAVMVTVRELEPEEEGGYPFQEFFHHFPLRGIHGF
jgi:hypothetical protein